MNKNNNMLLEYKKMLLADDSLYIETKNKINSWIGCASFLTNGEDKIKVFEGSGDGSDDKVLSFSEFLSNYSFEIKREV